MSARPASSHAVTACEPLVPEQHDLVTEGRLGVSAVHDQLIHRHAPGDTTPTPADQHVGATTACEGSRRRTPPTVATHASGPARTGARRRRGCRPAIASRGPPRSATSTRAAGRDRRRRPGWLEAVESMPARTRSNRALGNRTAPAVLAACTILGRWPAARTRSTSAVMALPSGRHLMYRRRQGASTAVELEPVATTRSTNPAAPSGGQRPTDACRCRP